MDSPSPRLTTYLLRSLAVGEMLDRVFFLYRRHFQLFIGISVIPNALALIVTLLVDALGGGSYVRWAATGLEVASLAVFILSFAATVFAVSDIYRGRAPSLAGCWRRSLSARKALFGTTLVNGLVVVTGLLCVVIPGIYLACRLLVAVPAALLEECGPGQSLDRSFRLTQGKARPAFVILTLFAVLYLAANLMVTIPFQFLGDRAASSAMLNNIVDTIAITFVIPFGFISSAVFYFDLRVHKEALDLELLLEPNGTPTIP